ncbi:hypothetical protein Aph01nite_40880 [Acrocarpospora phusangensis]|uniref:DUF4331 domain-containing protein n=1 Tax=Acrocarpospora phusangensis TaxID=1070424 RepID=A0A919QBU3_9ACTN|nr:DUF4331 family protein [Acrocarpospora phusangensis]GIH25778.1 hypothetical protein Aph01nite_40880 [Acrocarpospora phusangensis]
MSHHLDSPLARQDPRLDITDLYVFRGERGTVFVTGHSHSFAGQDIPRGLHPDGRYEIKIDGDGDAVEDLTYRFTFDAHDEHGHQAFRLHRLTGTEARDDSAGGELIAEGRTGTVSEVDGGGRVWAGEAGDPFWIEPHVLHAVGRAFHTGTAIDLSDWNPAQAKNPFAGHTIYAIVLEIGDRELLPVAGPGREVGVWALTSLATDDGGLRPVNRAGHPMIHPLFTQFDEDLGDRLNLNAPAEDLALHGKIVADMVAGVVGACGTAEDAGSYAQSVVSRIFPNVLPYTLGTHAVYGFAEWNGRSLTDNAPDVMFSFAANTPVTIGLTKESVTSKPTHTFPYVPMVR